MSIFNCRYILFLYFYSFVFCFFFALLSSCFLCNVRNRPDGETMKVEEEKEIEMKRGDVVTFSFESYSRRALPTEARIVRVRRDVTWQKVIEDYSLQIPQAQILSGMQLKGGVERRGGGGGGGYRERLSVLIYPIKFISHLTFYSSPSKHSFFPLLPLSLPLLLFLFVFLF